MKNLLRQNISQKQNLDDFLNSYCFSKKQKHLLKMEKRILVNHKPVQHNIVLNENDLVEIDLYLNQDDHLEPIDMNLKILYEDDFVLIVDKPIHMIVHDDGNHTLCLDQGVQFYYQKTNQHHPVRPIHRLDRDTSGCIFYCKQPYIQPYFDEQLKNKKIERTYLALVEGIIDKEMTIHSPIAKDRHISNKYRVSPNGKAAVTHLRPIQKTKNMTLIECTLQSGRTHQIRVHLASIHHPLIGDSLYGHAQKMRCALHSHSLSFIHPITHEKITVISELPSDMKACMRK